MDRTGVSYSYDKNVNLESSERSRFRVEMLIDQTIKGTRMVHRQYDTVEDDVESEGHLDWKQKIDSFDWKKLLDLLRRYIARKNDCDTTITPSSAWFTTKGTTNPKCTAKPKCTTTTQCSTSVPPCCTTIMTAAPCTTTTTTLPCSDTNTISPYVISTECTTKPSCTTTVNAPGSVILCVMTTTTMPPPPPASCIHRHTYTSAHRRNGKPTSKYSFTPAHWYVSTPPTDYDIAR